MFTEVAVVPVDAGQGSKGSPTEIAHMCLQREGNRVYGMLSDNSSLSH